MLGSIFDIKDTLYGGWRGEVRTQAVEGIGRKSHDTTFVEEHYGSMYLLLKL